MERVVPVRLLLVEDHAVVRQGLASLLASVPRYAVVGQASGAGEAMEAARRLEPDVVIMDIRLPDGDGIEACRELKSILPRLGVIMLTSHPDHEAVIASVLAGADGYLLKECEPERLFDAIDQVAKGRSLIDPAVTPSILAAIRTGHGPDDPLRLDQLSPGERRILPLIGEGLTNAEIAVRLRLSEHTVKAYVSSLLLKLGVSRRAQAAALASRWRPRTDR